MKTSAPVSEQALADKLNDLPPLPVLAMEILGSFDDPQMDVDTLAKHITNDQVLAARALRIANSPFYGLSGRVTSIGDAIVILGFRAVRSLMLSAAMVDSVNRIGNGGGDPRIFWRHSVAVALFARGLARYTGENPDAAFTAGLLHDMGRVVLEACFPDQYRAVFRWLEANDRPLREAERAVLGIDHAMAGALLARKWGLPATIVDAIGRHHAPDQGPPMPLTDICHCADILARALELDGRPRPLVPPMSDGAWVRVGPDWASLRGLLQEVEWDHEETCHALIP
ncbi:MAG: HDOD domain-containing protein [Rhodocyclaceae bacterium]|nr:MAG: HDOD domain-containing protein [Rhodocyclaceae bacterium]